MRFPSLERTPSLQRTAQTWKGWVVVELAGTCKAFQVNYEFWQGTSNSYFLNGKRAFTFAGFQLMPPRKLPVQSW